MTWLVSGGTADLLISPTAPLIRGKGAFNAKSLPDPAEPNSLEIAKAVRRMNGNPTDWCLLPASASDVLPGAASAELKKRAAADGSVARVSYFDDGSGGPPFVSLNVALTDAAFQRAYSLLTDAFLSSRQTTYQLTIGFLTFRNAGADIDLPTLAEFLAGRPYFSNEVSVAVCNSARDDV